jgi:hypothetical protein
MGMLLSAVGACLHPGPSSLEYTQLLALSFRESFHRTTEGIDGRCRMLPGVGRREQGWLG